jgi:hypothetical protein
MVSGSRPLDMTIDLAESWTVETIERAAALVADLGRCIGSGSSPLYGPMSIDCRDEEDAKRIARNLRRRRGRVVARTAVGVSPRRWFEGEDLTQWLSGSPS